MTFLVLECILTMRIYMYTGLALHTHDLFLKRNSLSIRKYHTLVQLIGYVATPSLDVLSAVSAAHKNGAALPYSASYHPTAHCKLHTLSLTGLRTMTSDAVTAGLLLSRAMSVRFSIFLVSQELSMSPAS